MVDMGDDGDVAEVVSAGKCEAWHDEEGSWGLKEDGGGADSFCMGRSVIGLCVGFGGLVGGYVPELWGASGFSVVSVLFGVAGGVAGVWLGLRLSDV
jgi:hypothetical protein